MSFAGTSLSRAEGDWNLRSRRLAKKDNISCTGRAENEDLCGFRIATSALFNLYFRVLVGAVGLSNEPSVADDIAIISTSKTKPPARPTTKVLLAGR